MRRCICGLHHDAHACQPYAELSHISDSASETDVSIRAHHHETATGAIVQAVKSDARPEVPLFQKIRIPMPQDKHARLGQQVMQPDLSPGRY